MPGSAAWSIVFFFMVLLLGMDTQFTVVEICTRALIDMFPQVCLSIQPINIFVDNSIVGTENEF